MIINETELNKVYFFNYPNCTHVKIYFKIMITKIASEKPIIITTIVMMQSTMITILTPTITIISEIKIAILVRKKINKN